MRKRWIYAIQLVLSLVIVITLAVGCVGSPSTSAPGSVTAPQKESVFVDKWEFTLNSHSIRSTNIDVNIAITSHFSTPNTYHLSDLGGVVCIDQYGKVFGDTIEEEIIAQNLRDFKNNPSDYLLGIKEYKDECFYDGEYYPGDTKVGNLKFVVNQKSGKITLWLYCKSYSPVKLFDLGEIK